MIVLSTELHDFLLSAPTLRLAVILISVITLLDRKDLNKSWIIHIRVFLKDIARFEVAKIFSLVSLETISNYL